MPRISRSDEIVLKTGPTASVQASGMFPVSEGLVLHLNELQDEDHLAPAGGSILDRGRMIW